MARPERHSPEPTAFSPTDAIYTRAVFLAFCSLLFSCPRLPANQIVQASQPSSKISCVVSRSCISRRRGQAFQSNGLLRARLQKGKEGFAHQGPTPLHLPTGRKFTSNSTRPGVYGADWLAGPPPPLRRSHSIARARTPSLARYLQPPYSDPA